MLTTRREFLKTAAAAGIVAGSSLLLGGYGSTDSRNTMFVN